MSPPSNESNCFLSGQEARSAMALGKRLNEDLASVESMKDSVQQQDALNRVKQEIDGSHYRLVAKAFSKCIRRCYFALFTKRNENEDPNIDTSAPGEAKTTCCR